MLKGGLLIIFAVAILAFGPKLVTNIEEAQAATYTVEVNGNVYEDVKSVRSTWFSDEKTLTLADGAVIIVNPQNGDIKIIENR